jgi:hypothetical protein
MQPPTHYHHHVGATFMYLFFYVIQLPEHLQAATTELQDLTMSVSGSLKESHGHEM